MSKLAVACPASRQHLADRSALRAAGIGSDAVARYVADGRLVRVLRGVYSPGNLPAFRKHLVSEGLTDPAYLAHVRAALMSLGGTAAAGGRTAAVLWAFDMLVEPAKVELVVPASRRRDKLPTGVTLRRHRAGLCLDEAVLGLDPVRLLSPTATVLDCALTRPLREAVAIADSALRGRRVSLADLHQLVETHRRHPKGVRLRRVVDLVDPQCGSILESALRVLLAQHGLHPETQVTMRDAFGRIIGRVDFLFRDQRLVVECDGRRWHDPEDARERDRVRGNELERNGWRLIRVTWHDVMHRPDDVVKLVRDCLEPWPVAA